MNVLNELMYVHQGGWPMKLVSRNSPGARVRAPRGIFHPSFNEANSERQYCSSAIHYDETLSFMPDEVTRQYAKRMHYAAWRTAQAKNTSEAKRWRRRYIQDRNQIVVGNHKLIYRAVQQWSDAGAADDLAGECHVVLIKAVAAFNPWLSVRFSTYAFTCLKRALWRLAQRHSNDRLARSVPLDAITTDAVYDRPADDATDPRLAWLGDCLRQETTALTDREKLVLSRRFNLDDGPEELGTLEQIGRAIGLSKERVRQLQNSALVKLRQALSKHPCLMPSSLAVS